MMGRRMGRPGLLGTVARTAVIAGTASATSNAVSRRQMGRAQQAADAAAYQQSAAQPPAAAPAAPPPAAPAAPAPEGGLGDQLTALAQLHQAGALSAEEFAAAKARLLG